MNMVTKNAHTTATAADPQQPANNNPGRPGIRRHHSAEDEDTIADNHVLCWDDTLF